MAQTDAIQKEPWAGGLIGMEKRLHPRTKPLLPRSKATQPSNFPHFSVTNAQTIHLWYFQLTVQFGSIILAWVIPCSGCISHILLTPICKLIGCTPNQAGTNPLNWDNETATICTMDRKKES